MIKSNFLYVNNYLHPLNGAGYDHILENSRVTTFYGVYPNETSVDWKYAKKMPFEDLNKLQEELGVPTTN